MAAINGVQWCALRIITGRCGQAEGRLSLVYPSIAIFIFTTVLCRAVWADGWVWVSGCVGLGWWCVVELVSVRLTSSMQCIIIPSRNPTPSLYLSGIKVTWFIHSQTIISFTALITSFPSCFQSTPPRHSLSSPPCCSLGTITPTHTRGRYLAMNNHRNTFKI